MAYPETLTANQQTTLLNFMTTLRDQAALSSPAGGLIQWTKSP